jgi:signal transduction histidine kinase
VATLLSSSVLIVSDDPEFARALTARWQAERHVPAITIVTGGVWHPASAAQHDLAIVGPLRDTNPRTILFGLNGSLHAAAILFAEDEKSAAPLRAEFPHLLVVPSADGWPATLILVAMEALRRVEATQRAQRAEMQALAAQGHAALGRYMLEMRPSVNNALTSVMGNADLLLAEPGFAAEAREQLETIRTMSFRLNEIMQRFSSLAAEFRAGEKESQAETQAKPYSLVSQS